MFSETQIGSEFPHDIQVSCWPITLNEESYAVPLDMQNAPIATIRQCSFEALTSFFAFQLSTTDNGESLSMQFVLNLPLHGAPEGLAVEGLLRTG